VSLDAPNNCYCTPIYGTTFNSGCEDGDVIARVILNTLDNNSGTGCPSGIAGYSDYTGDPLLTTTLSAGTSYGCTVFAGQWPEGYKAWIDYNQDGIFDNVTEVIGNTTSAVPGSGTIGVLGGSVTFPISLACNPTPGMYRLRIRCIFNNAGPFIDPCIFQSNWGETEDYLITIAPPPPCPQISGLIAEGITATTAGIDWNVGCAETEWDVDISLSSDTALIGTPSNGGLSDDTLSIIGLTAGTAYYAHVRAVCGPGVVSEWSTIAFSTTPSNNTCATAENLVQNASCVVTNGFNTSASASGAALAACAPFDATQDVWYEFTVINSTIVLNVDFITATNLGFAIYPACGGPDVLCGVLGDSLDNTIAGFTIGDQFFLRIFSNAANAGTFNICITTPPACVLPFGLAATNVSTNTADLSWFEGGTATAWDIYLGLAGFDTTGLAPTFTGVTNPYTAIGLTADEDYEFYVAGTGCSTYEGPFAFTTLPAPPVNDECANAIVVFGGYTVTGFSTVGATGTDITSCVFNDVNSVWFSYTPTCDLTVEVNTFGSNYDTGLAVFDACGGTELACNDDSGGGVQSSVTFSAIANTTYLIRIAGYSGSTGNINFTVVETTLCPCINNVWTGATNTDWSDGTNWTCGVAPTSACSSGSDNAIIPAGAATNPVITGVQGVGNLQIGTGESITIDGTLQACGNVSHLGTPVSGLGDLEFMGATAQTIMGSGRLGNMEVNNVTGVTVMASANTGVTGSCVLTVGTLTNTGSFSLFSNLAGTAYLDDFTGAGSYSGNITVQRFVASGPAVTGGLGQHYFGSAVDGGVVSGLDNTYTGFPLGQIIPLGCDPNQLDAASPYSNLFEWNESGPYPTNCAQEGWEAISASAPLENSRGYSGWMDLGQTLTVTGAPNTGGGASLAYSASAPSAPISITDARGWHLLANPYPSPLDISAVTNDNFSSPQYYDGTSASGYSGTFQPGFISGTIPVMQGFVAQTAGAETFQPDNSDRVASNLNVFYKSNNWFDYKLEVQVEVDGNRDITYLYYSNNNTDQFDIVGDCVKRSSDINKPTLYTKLASEEMSLNGYNLNDLGTSIPMGLIAPENATYTFSFDGIETFPANTDIYVEDLLTGTYHNVMNGSYTFNADPAENGTDRFMIHYVLPASFNLIEPSCEDAMAYLLENTNDGRNLEISNDGVVEMSGVLDGSSNELFAGDYAVEVFDNYGGSQTYIFLIDEVVAVDAQINASSTIIEEGEAIDFDYNGSGATSFNWYVNSQLVAQTQMFNYQFDLPGTYEIEMKAANNVCNASAVQTITVNEKTTGIVNVGDIGTLSIYSNENADIILDFQNMNQGAVQASIYNLLGQELATRIVQSVGKQEISNVSWANGYYIVKVKIGDQVINQTMLLNK
jgi:hypothetical protein